MQNYIDDLFILAIAEDIGDGDHTSLAVIPPEAEGKMKLLVKEEGVIAGIDIAKQLFRRIDRRLEMEQLLKDGARVQKGAIAFYVTGR